MDWFHFSNPFLHFAMLGKNGVPQKLGKLRKDSACLWSLRTTGLAPAVSIVDLTFRILTCRFLLAVVSRTRDLVCINLSFASRDFVCARSTATSQQPRLRIALFGFVHRRGHHAFRESSCVSLVHGPRWLFLLSRHREATVFTRL